MKPSGHPNHDRIDPTVGWSAVGERSELIQMYSLARYLVYLRNAEKAFVVERPRLLTPAARFELATSAVRGSPWST